MQIHTEYYGVSAVAGRYNTQNISNRINQDSLAAETEQNIVHERSKLLNQAKQH